MGQKMITRHTRIRRNRSPAYAEAEEAKRFGEMSTLLTLAAGGVLTLGITFAIYLADLKIPSPFSFAPAAEPAHETPPPPPFRLSGIQLGMTPVEMASVHPEILITDHPSGGIEGSSV